MKRDYLYFLEQEAIEILWKCAKFNNPYILFSGGKDSIVLLQLSIKAFFPAKIPFKLLHIDTGHNFPETLLFRDQLIKKYGLSLEVKYVADTIKKNGILEPEGKTPSRNMLQSITLMDAIHELKVNCCIGGGRRDEEKARAKERIFSLRSYTGEWNPYMQRPEPWNEYNICINYSEQIRAFPISNFTELDIWKYIEREGIALPSLYFAHLRKVVQVDNKWVAFSPYLNLSNDDIIASKKVRFRTIGDMTCTAALESNATSLKDIIHEIETSPISERGATRLDDQISDTAMEDRKKKGYF
ncbi:sulfate adenylyltransferase subunit CysD [Sediminibacterium sp.]|uniref:sulfate adenylyltransferase subunit CysD n=1 Tax=Sediminibacterium sp. TaxID=1917865 RepID=UPI003F71429F